MIELLMALSVVPVFLFIADGYYQKDLKKGGILFFLCMAFVLFGTIAVKIFRLKVLYAGYPLFIAVLVIAYFSNKGRKRN